MQLLFFTSLSAQEGENFNLEPNSAVHDSSSDAASGPIKDDDAVNKEKNTTIPDSTKKEKTESDNDAQKKSSAKSKPEIKPVQKTEDTKPEIIKEDKPDAIKTNEGLLLIDEGNFKYRRIPEIKLAEKAPLLAEQNIITETPIENMEETEKKKEVSYIDIGKILIILIVVGIFILYISRSSGPANKGNKTSKSRKVLNSYRK